MPDMRFAPPNPLRIADRASGLNATSVRGYNERLILSLLLQNEGISRQEIGKKTGLTFQTTSVLLRSLEQEGLVVKGEVQRGRKGAPTTEVVLNPDGAYSVGISIGRTQCDIVLVDFVGAIRFQTSLPNPGQNLKTNHPEFLQTIRQAIAMLEKPTRERLAGIGLALPTVQFGSGSTEQNSALQEEIEAAVGHSVFVQNDITSAAAGESMFGVAKSFADYLFFYLGDELHSRLILNHQIHKGNSSHSYDMGGKDIERRLKLYGKDTEFLRNRDSLWPITTPEYAQWKDVIVNQIGASITSLTQYLDLKAVVLCSKAPAVIINDICDAVNLKVQLSNVISGRQSFSPKALGAAGLPFSSRFMVE
jgi:predicted NBD/HSP70 family sugar kinase